jgi:maltose O-acetyltransferase
MMINDLSKRVIPFRPHDVKRMGQECYYIDWIIWLNGNRIELGEKCNFNVGCYVNGYGGLVMGDRSGLGPFAMIHTANHIFEDPDVPILDQGHRAGPVTMGRDVWIGMGAIILPGVTLGDGVVVGAGSVVTKDIEPWSVAVGNPAKPVKSRRKGETIQEAAG